MWLSGQGAVLSKANHGFLFSWSTHTPAQTGHPGSAWQISLGPPQQGPVSSGPLELWTIAKASAAPATCWAHQSPFVSLVSHCIIHTKGLATRAPTAPLCPELAFPKLPNPLSTNTLRWNPIHHHPPQCLRHQQKHRRKLKVPPAGVLVLSLC